MAEATYKVVRSFLNAQWGRGYRNGHSRTIKTGLTLEEAQKWCQNPETSSSTATSAKRKKYTRKHGPWFDGYDSE